MWQVIKANHPDKFPNIYTLVELCLILPLHTAAYERGFSIQNIIKSIHRNHLGEKALNELMNVKINGPYATFNPLPALKEWKTKTERRIFNNF